jgi:hypothetical protein
MKNRQRGEATAEYVAVITLMIAVIAALAVGGAGARIAASISDAIRTAICSIGLDSACGSSSESPPSSSAPAGTEATLDERIERLEANAQRRRDELLIETPEAAGSYFADLHNAIQVALDAGHIEEAERLDALLETYIALARGEDLEGSDRGQIIEDLWMSPEKWQQAIDAGTIYLAPDGDNVRYFNVPPAPGDGLIVLDFFIPFEESGIPPVLLKGDDRDFHPDGPLAQDLPLNESRVLIVIDRETGHGAIYQSHTCNTFYGQCREARPIALDMDERTQFVPQLSNDVSGPYIAPTNRFEIDADGDTITLTYDALNSMSWPVFAVEGTVELTRSPDGTYEITHDHRDHYPSIGIYQYVPGRGLHIIEERESEDVFDGATDIEWLPPWWPWD